MSNNIQQWNPGAANQESDAAYTADSLRSGGAGTDAIFPSATANKLFYNLSTFCAGLAQAFSNKGYSILDTSLSTLTGTLAAVLTLADFTISLSANGYVKFPGGLIVQWGLATNGSSGDLTVNFPISFPSACFSVVMQPSNAGGSGSRDQPYLDSVPTTSSFVTSNGQSTTNFYWIAIGH